MWGGVLGVLVGIMVGIYALPPILKHYYGETVVEAAEPVTRDGKRLSLESFNVTEHLNQTAVPFQTDFHVYSSFLVVSEEEWMPGVELFTLEIDGVEKWQAATRVAIPADVQDRILANTPTKLIVEFDISLAEEDAPEAFGPEAIHLSEPRIKFKVPEE
jgi:hypothetical protein